MRAMHLLLLNVVTLLVYSARAFKAQIVPTFSRHVGKLNPIGGDTKHDSGNLSRRAILSGGLSLVLLVPIDNDEGRALAFPNKISTKYDDIPKRRGPQPNDLGVATRKDFVGEEYLGLKNCKFSPNCFCSTDSELDDPEHFIPAWIWPKELGDDKEHAFSKLRENILAYQPGQGNVDGGGFQIVTFDAKNGYLYVQFEALKGGYIDDVEFSCIEGLRDHAVQVRSSSRVGYLDYGVNAKRLNYIAKALRSQGWNAPGVDLSLHPEYTSQNGLQSFSI